MKNDLSKIDLSKIDVSTPEADARFFLALDIYPREEIEAGLVKDFHVTPDEAHAIVERILREDSP